MLNLISKRKYGSLVLLIVVFTLLSNAWAKSSPQPTEMAANPLEHVKNVNNVSYDFYAFLLRFQGQVVPRADLQEEISKLETKTESYLRSLGVVFTKDIQRKEDFDFQGSYIQKATYATYQIESVEATEDLNSQFLAQMKSQSYTQDLNLVLNPFLQMTDSAVQGFFEPQSRSLVFGITALSYRVGGLGDTLAHEARHAYEHAKLLEGSVTLASVALLSSHGTDLAYSEFLRLDEIETHRQDIDYLENQAPEFEKYVVDKSGLKRLRQARAETLKFKQETLQRLVQSSRQFLSKLSQLLSSGSAKMFCAAETKGPLFMCQVSGVQGAAYETAEIRFVKSSTPIMQQLQEVIRQSLDQL